MQTRARLGDTVDFCVPLSPAERVPFASAGQSEYVAQDTKHIRFCMTDARQVRPGNQTRPLMTPPDHCWTGSLDSGRCGAAAVAEP